MKQQQQHIEQRAVSALSQQFARIFLAKFDSITFAQNAINDNGRASVRHPIVTYV